MVVPAETLASIRDVLKTVVPVLALVGRNIASDLGSGPEMLVAGAEGAFLNVRINAAYLKDRATAESALEQNGAILAEVRDIHRSIRETVETMLT
jgi:formiminotetrahydrofolate cyclodeaminase